jgi:hypothetical protein
MTSKTRERKLAFSSKVRPTGTMRTPSAPRAMRAAPVFSGWSSGA